MAVPTWISNYANLFTKYGSGLSVIGMDPHEIGVFTFLLARRWNGEKSEFSASEITSDLKMVSDVAPEGLGVTHSDRSTRSAIKRLTFLEFVRERKNSTGRKGDGRPPKMLYKAAPIATIKKSLHLRIDSLKQNIDNAIGQFEMMDEEKSMKESPEGSA